MSDGSEFELFLKTEIRKIDIDKWIEGENIHSDPGNEYVKIWIENNAENVRNFWNISKCKDCLKCEECGIELLSACCNFSKK